MILPVTITAEMVGLVTAIGISINAYLTYRANAKTEDTKQLAAKAAIAAEMVRLELEKNNQAKLAADKIVAEAAAITEKKIDKISDTADKTLNTADKTLKEANHNYQTMQRDLAKAHEELAKLYKEFTTITQALAAEKRQPQSTMPYQPQQTPSAEPNKGDIQVAKLEVELQSKPTQASKDGVEGKEDEKEIKVEKLELELVNKPKPPEGQT